MSKRKGQPYFITIWEKNEGRIGRSHRELDNREMTKKEGWEAFKTATEQMAGMDVVVWVSYITRSGYPKIAESKHC